MVKLIDFEDTRQRALTRGFAKGLCSPALVFIETSANPVKIGAVQIPKIDQVKLPPSLLKADWERLLTDVQAACERYATTEKT